MCLPQPNSTNFCPLKLAGGWCETSCAIVAAQSLLLPSLLLSLLSLPLPPFSQLPPLLSFSLLVQPQLALVCQMRTRQGTRRLPPLQYNVHGLLHPLSVFVALLPLVSLLPLLPLLLLLLLLPLRFLDSACVLTFHRLITMGKAARLAALLPRTVPPRGLIQHALRTQNLRWC